MKYAIVKNDEIVNIVEYDGKSTYKPDGELVKIGNDSLAQPGWVRNKKGEFVEPKPDKKPKD